MPIMDGIDCAKAINKLANEGVIPKTPIIAVSAAEETTTLKEKLHEAGICLFVQKPMTKAKFQHIVKEFNI